MNHGRASGCRHLSSQQDIPAVIGNASAARVENLASALPAGQ
jgi:hypothetical protein